MKQGGKLFWFLLFFTTIPPESQKCPFCFALYSEPCKIALKSLMPIAYLPVYILHDDIKLFFSFVNNCSGPASGKIREKDSRCHS